MSKDRFLQIFSVAGYALMVVSLILMVFFQRLFSPAPLAIITQVLAGLLMVWARITFGSRSFHYAASPTEGGLVTNGPYHYIRHPIYVAIILFAIAGATANASLSSFFLMALLVMGVGMRIYCEEHLIVIRYPEYAQYAARTKRVLPFVF